MKTIYSTGVNFASHGQGTTAYYVVRFLYKAGILRKLICMAHRKTEISEKAICSIFPLGRVTEKAIIAAARFFGSANGYGFKDSVYDYFASKHIERCDVFHGWAMQSLLSLSAAKKRGAATILEKPSFHILAQKRILEEEYAAYRTGRKTVIENIEIERNLKEYELADYIFVPSRRSYATFREEGFNMKKIMIMPYGFDPSLFKPQPKANDKFRVIYCGHISLNKGIQYLLSAWHRLKIKGAELVLVGKVFPEIKGILKRCLSNTQGIVIKGFIPYQDMVNQYNKAEVFAFPSLTDGFGLVVLEAMGCGLPVIVTQNAGAEECVNDGINGFILPARDADAIAEKIQYFYDNRTKTREMGESAGRRAGEFTWSRCGERLLNTYKQILRQR